MKEKIKEILYENYKSLNGQFGEKQEKGKMFLRREDAKRKRHDRAKAKKKESSQNRSNDNVLEVDPQELKRQKRESLVGELKLTPKQAFLSRLTAYLESGQSKHMIECFRLMEDYPKLKKHIKERSKKSLPKYTFKAYATRERLNEEIGEKGCRCDGNSHNWTLSRSMAGEIWNTDEPYLMECSVNPDDVVIYVPAFAKDIEHVILNGLVDEPTVNVVRKAKILEEIILPEQYNEGIIIEI